MENSLKLKKFKGSIINAVNLAENFSEYQGIDLDLETKITYIHTINSAIRQCLMELDMISHLSENLSHCFNFLMQSYLTIDFKIKNELIEKSGIQGIKHENSLSV